MAVYSIQLQRNSLHYILCSFIPSLFLTLLSYITIWLNPQKINNRLNLNLFALGIIMLLLYNSLCLTIHVHYMKAVDIFIAICCCFSIMTLIESSFVINSYNLEHKLFHSSKIINTIINLVETALKIAFPVFFLFFILIFIFLYID